MCCSNMYLRTVKSGRHEYVQACHNYREGGSGPSRTRVLFSFGRKDQLDLEALRRLVSSISRYLNPAEAAEVRAIAPRSLCKSWLSLSVTWSW